MVALKQQSFFTSSSLHLLAHQLRPREPQLDSANIYCISKFNGDYITASRSRPSGIVVSFVELHRDEARGAISTQPKAYQRCEAIPLGRESFCPTFLKK